MRTRIITLASIVLALGCQPQDRTMDRSERAGEPLPGQDSQVIIDRTDTDAASDAQSEVTFRQARGDQVAWYRAPGADSAQRTGADPDPAGSPSAADDQIQRLASRAGEVVNEWEEPASMRERRSGQGDRPGTLGTPSGTTDPGTTPPDQADPMDTQGTDPVGTDPVDAPTGTADSSGLPGQPHMTEGQLQVTLAHAAPGEMQSPSGAQQPAAPGQTVTADMRRVELDVNFQDAEGREVRLQTKRTVQAPIEEGSGGINWPGQGQQEDHGAWFVADVVLDGQVVDSDRLFYLSAQPLQERLTQAPAPRQQAVPAPDRTPRLGTQGPGRTTTDRDYAVHLVGLPVSMPENQAARVEPLSILQQLDPHPQEPSTQEPSAAADLTGSSLDLLHIVFGDADRIDPAVSQPAG